MAKNTIKFSLVLKSPIVVELDRGDEDLLAALKDNDIESIDDATADDLHDAFRAMMEEDEEIFKESLQADDFDVLVGDS